MRVLVVDDNPERHKIFKQVYFNDELVHAFTYTQAIKELRGPRFDVTQLDHDLGDHQEPEFVTTGMYDSSIELTGYHVAQFLALDMPKERWPDKVVIHSINPDGAKNIAMLLLRNGVPFTTQPFVIQGG